MTRSKVFGNSLALALNFGAGTLLALAQVKLLTTWLVPEEYGRLAALRGFSLLLSTAMLVGAPQVVLRFVPSLLVQGRRARALMLYSGSSLLAIGISFLLLWGWTSGWMPLARAGVAGSASTELGRWVTLSVLFLSLRAIQNGFLMGLRSMGIQAVIDVFHLLLIVTGIYLARESLTLIFIFKLFTFASAAGLVAGLAAIATLIRRAEHSAAAEYGAPESRGFFARYWAGALFLSIVALAFGDLDRYLLSLLLVLESVAVYHLVGRILELFKRFLSVPSLVLHPELTRLQASGRRHELRDDLSLYLRLNLLLGILASFVLVMLGRYFISWISGPAYSKGIGLLVLLACGLPLSNFVAPLTTAMKALRHMGSAVLCDLAWMVGYFGTLVPFVRLWGIEGVGAAQLAGVILQTTTATYLSARQDLLRLPGRSILRLAGYGIMLAGLAAVSSLYHGGREGILAWGVMLLGIACVRFLIARSSVFGGRDRDRLGNLLPPGWGRTAVALALGRTSQG